MEKFGTVSMILLKYFYHFYAFIVSPSLPLKKFSTLLISFSFLNANHFPMNCDALMDFLF